MMMKKERETMKKLLSLLLILLLLGSSVAMAEQSLVGGWTTSPSPEITEDLALLFEKGLSETVGVSYVPVAYLGSQLVAGTNHCYLCQATVVYPDAQPYYALVYLYQALDGSVSLLNVQPLQLGLE